jgi:putative transposase
MSERSAHRESGIAISSLQAELRRCRRELERLRVEDEILREAAEPCAPARERFTFVQRLRDRFSVKRLGTDPGSFYAWVRAQARRDERAYDEQELAVLIVEVHTAHPAYRVERITRELQRQGVEVGRRAVTRLMRANGIAGITRRRRRDLTKPDKGAATVPDLIRREFTAPMPGLKLIGDISCFPTGEDRLHLATVLDLCSKELIGHAIAPHMRAELAVDAITAAHRTGLAAENAIIHTDRGPQYHSKTYRNALRRLETRQNTSHTDSGLDDATAESFFATIKAEIGIATWTYRAAALTRLPHCPPCGIFRRPRGRAYPGANKQKSRSHRVRPGLPDGAPSGT